MHCQTLSTLALGVLAITTATAQALQGFNYGSTKHGGGCQRYAGFKELFKRARHLAGAPGPGFTAARLYTSIQCDTAASPIEAYEAAIDTDTKIFVGLWASAGRGVFENELNALLAAARTLGPAFADRVVAISVGSEDLYRNSSEGVRNNAGQGAAGEEIVGYVGWLRDWVKGTLLEGKPITHVDTW